MCAHIKLEEETRAAGVEAALHAIRGAGSGELEKIARAVEARRRALVLAGEGETLPPTPPSVVEARPYGDGWLQLEIRTYEHKKSRGVSERGPYWYFRYHEGGRQKKLYLGKTEDPEAEERRRLRYPPQIAVCRAASGWGLGHSLKFACGAFYEVRRPTVEGRTVWSRTRLSSSLHRDPLSVT
jgi:hypothetical protein